MLIIFLFVEEGFHMSFNKMMQLSVSTALMASLLVGCQASDKQRTQIKRGGGGATGPLSNKAGDLSTGAKTQAAQEVDMNQATQVFKEFTYVEQNREILVDDLEDGDYVLSHVLYDSHKVNESRMNLRVAIDGETVCTTTKAVTSTTSSTPTTQSTARGKSTPAPKTQSASVNICNPDKIVIESSLNASANSLLSSLKSMTAASYLRFTAAKGKALSVEAKNLVQFRFGVSKTDKGLGVEVLPINGSADEVIFALLQNQADAQLNGKLYTSKADKNKTVAIRKINDNNGLQVISITYEVLREGRTVSLSFRYKKAARTAENTQDSNTNTANQPKDQTGETNGVVSGDTLQNP